MKRTKHKKLILNKIKHYCWCCSSCATEAGGIYPEGHVCTMTAGICNVCGDEGVTLIPWVDFNWPEDNELNFEAHIRRD